MRNEASRKSQYGPGAKPVVAPCKVTPVAGAAPGPYRWGPGDRISQEKDENLFFERRTIMLTKMFLIVNGMTGQ